MRCLEKARAKAKRLQALLEDDGDSFDALVLAREIRSLLSDAHVDVERLERENRVATTTANKTASLLDEGKVDVVKTSGELRALIAEKGAA
jgi:iron only hydrogenase large subunit-like protein